jgi:hypothetical protein
MLYVCDAEKGSAGPDAAGESRDSTKNDAGYSLQPARMSALRYCAVMAQCKRCGEEVDNLVSIKLDGKTKKVCEDCADQLAEQSDIAEQSEAAVQQMMGFQGRR